MRSTKLATKFIFFLLLALVRQGVTMLVSPAFERNKDPILQAIRETGIANAELVLELGSGPVQRN